MEGRRKLRCVASQPQNVSEKLQEPGKQQGQINFGNIIQVYVFMALGWGWHDNINFHPVPAAGPDGCMQ